MNIWLSRLASLKLSFAAILLVMAGSLAGHLPESGGFTWSVGVPLGLFFVNLLAAIAVHPALRGNLPLLLFHLALAALVGVIALGRATYLDGRVRVVEGGAFDGTLLEREAGPLHRDRLSAARFENHGFIQNFAPSGRVHDTFNRVFWRDESGRTHEAVIGDDVPLKRSGYRFYTTRNWGLAPVFDWVPNAGGAPSRGAVMLPRYLLNPFGQAMEWTPPGGVQPLWILFDPGRVALDPLHERTGPDTMPTGGHIVVRLGTERAMLQPGEWLTVPEGRLRYVELRTWMGYRVAHDWTEQWLLSACLIGLVSLTWFYWGKFTSRPWLREGSDLPRDRSQWRVLEHGWKEQ